jgi:hypothetical protein
MAAVFAEFHSGPPKIRKDTRVYLVAGRPRQNKGRCIGILWMCNPGGTDFVQRRPWGKWPIDETMRAVLPIFDRAQEIALLGGRGASADDYIQILNLFYVCDSKPNSGRATYSKALTPYHESPHRSARFTWIGWGKDARLDWLPRNPILSALPNPFFYSKPKGALISRLPKPIEYPVHPRAFAIHRLANSKELIAQKVADYL